MWQKHYFNFYKLNFLIKDTHWEYTLSNKIQVLKKITNMDIWLNGTLNQLFMRGF